MAELNNLTSTKIMKLTIVSAEESLFSGNARYIAATGKSGELGIYPGHLQLLTVLKPGQIRFEKEDGQQDVIYISGGILEVQPDVVTVLADTAMRAEDIDEVAAAEAKRRAEEILSQKGARTRTDYQQALIQVAEASAKLRAIKELHKYTQH
ncbi:MAG: F0F1 ATP synthase subunit epsilon [Pseudomonadota bacterium]